MRVNNEEAVKSFAQDKNTEDRSENIFSKDGVIYSYGKHFPMGVWCENAQMYILNGDRYSNTTAKHQSDCRYFLKPNVIIPFSVFRNFKVSEITFIKGINILDRTEDKEREVPYIDPKTKEQKIRIEHLLGSVLFKWRQTNRHKWRYFLSSTDASAKSWGMGYFLVELPKEVKTIDEAYNVLLPDELQKNKKIPYQRQGEFFFIPEINLDEKKLKKIDEKNLSVLFNNNSGNPHNASEVRKDRKKLFVKGTIRHPEHKMLKLGKVWHRVLINNALNSFNSIGSVD